MLKIHKDYSLRNNTTFGINIACSFYCEPINVEEIIFALNHAREMKWQYMVIGEGSNLLFIRNFDGLIIHPMVKGVDKVDESESEILLRVGAGENWDNFVSHCVSNSWYGTENLSLIPGSVGATPVQNIGAYGVEAKDIIEYVEVYDTFDRNQIIFSNIECEFGYRTSLFKHSDKNRFVVTHVVFRLQKNGALKLEYGNVEEELKFEEQNLQNLRASIISIREQKLPDPSNFGNAGSFFKNPVISKEAYQQLVELFGKVPNYPATANMIKIPAAWLIEKAEWKGVRDENVGTWPHQPLVIVNYGQASGEEIFEFSERIRLSIKEKFDINLQREVTLPTPSLLVS